MAWPAPIQYPTALSIKSKFPEFGWLDNTVIEYAIEEASRLVDGTWTAGDQLLGASYATAHILMVSISRAESGTDQVVSSETIGRLVTSYSVPQQPREGSESDFTTTSYGTRFVSLAKRNIPAIAII
jgi:uncharacterized protein DUF4054